MKKQLVTTIILLFLPLIFVSCISSLLKEKAPTFSTEVKLTAPAAPFVSQNTSVYPSWKNPKTGNVISIISDCDPNSNVSLNQMHLLLEDSLTEVKVIKEESSNLHDKPALSKSIVGLLDGFAIEIRSLSFKRKSCSYVSSLSGKKEGLEADLAQFNQFNTNLVFE